MITKNKIIKLGVIVILFLLVWVFASPFRHVIAQIKLAKEFGVNFRDYSAQIYFPAGYFRAKLTSGMTVDEVHQIVNGYDKVVLCTDTAELYFYFGENDNRALRIKILYMDVDGKLDNGIQDLRYQYVETEDDQSRVFGDTSDCPQGLLTKTGK